MKIAVLGTGSVGGTLGRRWAQFGHQVIFGSRDPSAEKVQRLLAEAGPTACAGSPQEAVSASDVILLSTPWTTVPATLASLTDLHNKVLIDCINPLNETFSGLTHGHTNSAAELVAAWAPSARVVKAFNTVSSKVMADANFLGQPATLFVCGDDADAKQTVQQLASDLGFEAVDAGPLLNARYLEPLAMLYIHLAVREGWGSNTAFKILKRPKQ
ncbi:MAG TPA: NADPH-dependent F420 reductase [Pirellulaceae bacterium]|nr:NADPH-dependent F420 reductase [Pirellulaceae bacterium]